MQPGRNSTRCTKKKVIKSTNPQRMPPTCRASMPHTSFYTHAHMHTSHTSTPHAASLCHWCLGSYRPANKSKCSREHLILLAGRDL